MSESELRNDWWNMTDTWTAGLKVPNETRSLSNILRFSLWHGWIPVASLWQPFCHICIFKDLESNSATSDAVKCTEQLKSILISWVRKKVCMTFPGLQTIFWISELFTGLKNNIPNIYDFFYFLRIILQIFMTFPWLC